MRETIASLILAALAIGPLAGCTAVPAGRTSVDAIDVSGNKVVAASDIEDRIATSASPKFLGLFRGVVYDYAVLDRFVVERDLARIERLYQARGYYDAHARAARITTMSDGHARVEIVVDEGAPVHIAHVAVVGLPPAIDASTRAIIGGILPIGAPFEEAAFDDALATLGKTLGDAGYAFAKLQRDAAVDLYKHEASVTFIVTPDQPATLGPVRIDGLRDLPEEPVRRALALKEGDPYSRTSLQSAQQALLDLGVFSSVDITPTIADPPPTPRVVPIVVHVQPTRLRTLSAGGGLELDAFKTDVHGKVGWEHKNVFGGLERFSVELKPGVVIYPTRIPGFQKPEKPLLEEKLRMDLRRPGLFEARTSGFVGGELNVYPAILTPTYVASDPVIGYTEGKGSVGVDRRFGKLYVRLEQVVQVSNPFAYINALPIDLPPLVVSYPRLYATLDLRDDSIEPHKGFYFDNELQVAGDGGQVRDLRILPEARAYAPVGKLTLAFRGTFGFLFPFSYTGSEGGTASVTESARNQQIVYFRGFFSGGPNSNRGYPVRGVGPQGAVQFLEPRSAQLTAQCQTQNTVNNGSSPCLVPLGGLTLWEMSTELRIPISGPFSTVTFCDASDVSGNKVDVRFTRPHLSCGAGARYATPIGPIRFDVAFRIPGLQELGQDKVAVPGELSSVVPIALQFGIGEAF